MAKTSSASSITVRRFDMKTDLLLALLPSAIIILVLVLVKAFSKQGVLFSSLASSAFLIYLDPKHPANSIRTLIIAQVSAAVIGYLVYLAAGSGYISAAISMVISITVMILLKAMHPPAVSTALVFAFQYSKVNTLMLFMLATLLLIVLIVLQHASLWLIKRSQNKNKHHERIA